LASSRYPDEVSYFAEQIDKHISATSTLEKSTEITGEQRNDINNSFMRICRSNHERADELEGLGFLQHDKYNAHYDE
jgi:hypothetical protein